MNTRPKKPFKTFPLFAHANGQWAKKIRGKLHYFGPWADPQAALDRYKDEHAYYFAGADVPVQSESVASVVKSYLASKTAAVDCGALDPETYDDYSKICDCILSCLGRQTPIAEVERHDLERLRGRLVRGKHGRVLSPVSQRREIVMARLVLNFANEELGHAVRYRKVLRTPPAKAIRKARNEVGERLFRPDEVNALLTAAKPQLKAMIYLGVNCGYGNGDCAQLPISAVDLAGGWVTFPRPKTGIMRRCPLWPETAAALYAVIKSRKDGPVFVTKYGNAWEGKGKADPISYEFRKLVRRTIEHRKGVTTFYSLRRTFETIGATTGDQVAVNYIMGHAPASSDMAAVYRQKTFDIQLRKVTDYVRDWLSGEIKLT